MEACWAHNPEVRRSKLRSAKILILTCYVIILIRMVGIMYFCMLNVTEKIRKPVFVNHQVASDTLKWIALSVQSYIFTQSKRYYIYYTTSLKFAMYRVRHRLVRCRACGLMDKASDFGSEDCRFESCHGR